MGLEALVKVEVPAEWANVKEEEPVQPADEPDFVTRIQRPMARLEGDELPVSTFTESNMEDGTFPLGTTAYEKRALQLMPEWQIDNVFMQPMFTGMPPCSYQTLPAE